MFRTILRKANVICGSTMPARTPVGKLAILLAALLIGGCVSDAPLPTPAPQTSLIEYTRNLEQVTSTLLDKVVVAIPNPGTDYPDFTDWSANWCPRHQRVHSPDDVARQIGNFCKQYGGVYSHAFCRDPANPDHVFFFAAVFRQGDCQQVAYPVGVHILESKQGHDTSPAYLAALEKVGYRTQAQIAFEAAERSRIAEERIERERERLTAQMPLLTKRGTKICARNGPWMYIGFVQDFSSPKIEIQVAAQRSADDPNGLTVPGFTPYVIWDLPEHWSVCE